MKRLYLLIFSLIVIFTTKAQSPTEFTQNINGVTITYKIIDQANRHVEVSAQSGGAFTPPQLTFPEAVYKSGETQPYTITKIAGGIFNGTLGQGWTASDGTVTITFPSSLEEIGWMAFAHAYDVKEVDLSKCTKLKKLEGLNFHRGKITKLSLPEGLEKIGEHVFDDNKLVSVDIPSTVKVMNGGAFGQNPMLKIVNLRKVPVVPISDLSIGFGDSSPLEGADPNLKIYVNTDLTGLYATARGWSDEAGKYIEAIDMNTTGYASLYLENENFEVPAGCTAYIITGVTPSGSPTTPDQAVVKAFGAGKIIPKQTGFILQGAPNTTIEYRAAVTGAEENVSGNMLIGTATTQEFSSAGNKYYILANGGEGIGFYKQGTRDGASIKLAAHRAGLCLPDAIAPAKGFIVDFEAARSAGQTTGLRNIGTTKTSGEDIIYDLQGRRITHPTHGIYIINGKKVLK